MARMVTRTCIPQLWLFQRFSWKERVLLNQTCQSPYTEYAGCAITTAIPVKFGTAYGR